MGRRFDALLTTRTGFATLDRLLARLYANKTELLVVLDRPEVPLNSNGSENDVRAVGLGNFSSVNSVEARQNIGV